MSVQGATCVRVKYVLHNISLEWFSPISATTSWNLGSDADGYFRVRGNYNNSINNSILEVLLSKHKFTKNLSEMHKIKCSC